MVRKGVLQVLVDLLGRPEAVEPARDVGLLQAGGKLVLDVWILGGQALEELVRLGQEGVLAAPLGLERRLVERERGIFALSIRVGQAAAARRPAGSRWRGSAPAR
jgi:hypothetical protein